MQRLNQRDLHRLVDFEPFPVESLDLFGVHSRATQDEASGLDHVTRALNSVAESGAEPSLLVVGRAGRISFVQGAGRRLLVSYFGDRGPDRLPKLLADWATDVAAPGELVVDGVEGQLVVSAVSREPAGPTVVLLHERPWELPRSRRLTERELEVLALVDEGKTNAEIAHILWVAPSTIRKHLENAYAKLGVNSRTEATALLRREAGQAKNY